MDQPRLIAIDMDGTLLDSSGRISARNAAALRLDVGQPPALVAQLLLALRDFQLLRLLAAH